MKKKKRKKKDFALEKKVKDLETKVEEMENKTKPISSFIKKEDVSSFKWMLGFFFVLWLLYAIMGEWGDNKFPIFLGFMVFPLLLGVEMIWDAYKRKNDK